MGITSSVLFIGLAALVIGLPYGLWRLRPVRSLVPLVVVQILVGLALGPSLLGAVAPSAWAMLFPPKVLDAVGGLSTLAVLFFAFITGVHFDLAELRGQGRAFVATSFGSFLVPALLGGGAGLWLWHEIPSLAGAQASVGSFTFGLAIATAVTALPVLGAILREMHLLHGRLGSVALGCAAVNDVGLWLIVAMLLAFSGGGGAGGVLAVIGSSLLYLAVLIWVVRPLLNRALAHAVFHQRVNERDVVLVSALMLVSAAATELTGLHAIIGAFAVGAILPKPVAADMLSKFESFVTVIMLPFFFMGVGLRAQFELGGGAVLTTFLLMTVVSMAGKVAGTTVPWKLFGAGWRDSLALGGLMQCKGLMEIVVLTMLYERDIIGPTAFSAMVLVALVTTAITKPAVRLALGGGR